MSHQPVHAGGLLRGVRQVWGSERYIARATWRVLAAAAALSGAALVLLHVWVFWGQLTSGRLFEGGSTVRWVLGLLLCAALFALRRQGVPLWRGRRALSVWLLVVLLHAWSAAASRPPSEAPRGGPVSDASTAFLLPVAAATLASLTVLLLVRARRPRHSPLSLLSTRVDAPVALACCRWAGAARVPRAPPAFAI